MKAGTYARCAALTFEKKLGDSAFSRMPRDYLLHRQFLNAETSALPGSQLNHLEAVVFTHFHSLPHASACCHMFPQVFTGYLRINE
jgi:hypothetical protein